MWYVKKIDFLGLFNMKSFVKGTAISVLILICLICLFFFISRSHDTKFLKAEEITLYIYQSGHVVSQQVFPPYSNMHRKLNLWLSNHSSGWKHNINSYAPKFYLKSKGVSVTFLEGVAVINFSEWSDTAHTSLIREIRNPDFVAEHYDVK